MAGDDVSEEEIRRFARDLSIARATFARARRRAMIGSMRIARKSRNQGRREARNRKHDTRAHERDQVGGSHAKQL